MDSNWIEPSSHPRARIVDLEFAETDQMVPPLEFMVLLVNFVGLRVFDAMSKVLTRTQPLERSHSSNSLPPPVLKSRRSLRVGTSPGLRVSGCRKVKVSVSTFDGRGPVRVWDIQSPASRRSVGHRHTFDTTHAWGAWSVGLLFDHPASSMFPLARPMARWGNLRGEATLAFPFNEGKGSGGKARAVIAAGR